MLSKGLIISLIFCMFFLFACKDDSQANTSTGGATDSGTDGDGSGQGRPTERSQKIKQAEKNLIGAFDKSNCSDLVKDYYKDRIEDLEHIYSDDQIVESRVNDMIKLIKDIGC